MQARGHPPASPAVGPVREGPQFSWGLGRPWQAGRWPKPGLRSGPPGAGRFCGSPGPQASLLNTEATETSGWGGRTALQPPPDTRGAPLEARRAAPLPQLQMGKLRHSAVTCVQRSGCPFGCLSRFSKHRGGVAPRAFSLRGRRGLWCLWRSGGAGAPPPGHPAASSPSVLLCLSPGVESRGHWEALTGRESPACP